MNTTTSAPAAPPDWQARADQFRERRWDLAQNLLVLGKRMLLQHFLSRMEKANSLAQLDKIISLASKLAQLSTDLSLNNDTGECRACCEFNKQMMADLDKVMAGHEKREQESETATLPSPALVNSPTT